MHPSPVADALSAVAFGATVTHDNLVMLPLISRGTMEAIFAGNARPIETFVDTFSLSRASRTCV